MSWAVSESITSVILWIWPCFISMRITSTARSDMRLASSWMVIVSGIVTSRDSFSFCSTCPRPLIRCWRRRNEATERVRSSSPDVAVAMVRRPRLRSPPGDFGVLGGVMILSGMPGRRITRLVSDSSSLVWAPRPGAGRAAAAHRRDARRSPASRSSPARAPERDGP